MSCYSVSFMLAITIAEVGCSRKATDLHAVGETVDSHAQPTMSPNPTSVVASIEMARITKEIPQVTSVDMVQADARRCINAMLSGDLDTLLAYSYPKIIELMGGASKAKVALEKETARGNAAQIKLESLMFPEEPTFLQSDVHQFAIVPTKYILAAKGQREEFVSCLIGIKENGAARWTFVDTSSMNAEKVERFLRKYLPDFPSNHRIPPSSRRKL